MPQPAFKRIEISASEETEIKATFERAQRKDAFWAQHYQKLLKQYPDKYVAADDEGIVAVANDLLDIVRKIEDKGRRPTDLYVKFMDTDYGNWIV